MFAMSLKEENERLKRELQQKTEELFQLKLKSSTNNTIFKEKEHYFQDILSHVPGFVYWLNKDNIYLGCNASLALQLGLDSNKDIIGKKNQDLPWKKQADQLDSLNNKVMTSGKSHRAEEIAEFDGIERYFISEKIPIFNDEKLVIGLVGISIDITEQKQLEHELIHAKEIAEVATRAKTEFLANMSHDIRTPLSGVIGMSELLEKHLKNPEEKEEAKMLHKSGNQLLNMLNEILDDVRAGKSSEVDIKEEEFDLQQCIQNLIELELPTTTIKHLGLKVDIDANVPRYIVSDKAKISRTLLNLLGNSIKFTETGHVTIEVKCLDRTDSKVHLQFGVADTGIGIADDKQDKVFDKFFRIDPSYKGVYTGHGLGLSIAHSFVSLLGGHITLTSKQGVGTTFYFDLECKVGIGTEIISDIENTILDGTTQYNNLPTSKLSDISHASHIDSNAPHILWVEDNALLIKAFESMVREVGCRFTCATSGEQALELARTEKFDVIISDIGLPGISGTELSQFIRDWEKASNKTPIPIIGLSGHADARDNCLACGMNDVFTKPIELKTLQSIISQLVPSVMHTPYSDQKDANRITKETSSIGLPDTEDKLFELNSFLIFDTKDALKYNNISIMIDMLKMYVSDTMQLDIQSMEQAYLTKDWFNISKLAHKIQGGVGFMGLSRMHVACRYLELYYATNQSTLLDKLYHQIIAVNSDTIDTVKTRLKNLKLL